MAMAETTPIEEARKNAGLLIFLGMLTVVFGALAIASPFIAGVAVALLVGFLLLFAGIARIAHAFKSKHLGTGIWGAFVGFLGVAAGLVMLVRPVVGLAWLALLLAIYFLAAGVCEIITAFKVKPHRGWGWVLFNGIIAVLLGFLIWLQWPVSGAWAVGLLVGVHILITGFMLVSLGAGARGSAPIAKE
jgi:uncharacterized membrane protein HdeD (DUF308 family)